MCCNLFWAVGGDSEMDISKKKSCKAVTKILRHSVAIFLHTCFQYSLTVLSFVTSCTLHLEVSLKTTNTHCRICFCFVLFVCLFFWPQWDGKIRKQMTLNLQRTENWTEQINTGSAYINLVMPFIAVFQYYCNFVFQIVGVIVSYLAVILSLPKG